MTNRRTQIPDQSERALRTLLYAMLVGLLAVLIYAIDSNSWTRFFMSVGTGVVVAAAALLIGSLLGFLFGIPRTLQQPSVPALAGGIAENPNEPSGVTQARREYQANTNLEQISDWLTKILVGVGLTQVRQIGDKLYSVAGGVAWSLSDTRGNRSFALALILFYLVAGFLFSYLWTRLYLPGAFWKADRDLEDQILSLKTKVEEADLRSRDAEATSLGTGKAEPEEVTKKLLSEEITPGNPDDPWNERFGGSSINNDRELQAEVKPVPGSSGLYAIRLTVRSLHPESNPLKGAVQFFLHPTFRNDKPVVTVGPNGIAELNLKAWGAFTVGALADDGKTKLELDLSQLESAPAEFRNR